MAIAAFVFGCGVLVGMLLRGFIAWACDALLGRWL